MFIFKIPNSTVLVLKSKYYDVFLQNPKFEEKVAKITIHMATS